MNVATPLSAGRNGALILPAVAVLAGLFIGPMIYFLIVSFFKVSLFKIVPAFDLGNYAKVLGAYGVPILFTMAISFLIASITTVLAFVVAHLIWTRGRGFSGFLLAATLLTLFGGYLVKIYAWRTLLGRDGIVNNTLVGLGIVREPIEALLYSPIAVVLVLVSYLLPFAILPLYGALRSIETKTIEAARDLGASPWVAVRDAVLPRCVPALVTAFALCFLVTAGDYVTPRMVGGTQTMMMGNFIESQFGLRMNVPLGAAMTYLTIIVSVAVISLVWIALKTVLRPK
ncbi:ABC transporter permease [Sinorhizobium sp. BG8]|uniref:ABC transporter permease n=1 Tax=Sinorhizobium sp. BG8 TaxID=2613773 RepID=UPI00193DC495|nr:ABC transporter permease [Sinorhizobium sp. BG8]QRM57672.1 ABC transporter permease [Sinorhizobium sp. BG8]